MAWVQLEKGLASNTVESYEKDLIQCALHLHEQGISNWQKVGVENLSNWLSSLTDHEYAATSLARKLSAVRMLAKFLVGEGKLREDFTELLANPRKSRQLPNCLTIEEMTKISRGDRFEHSAWQERQGAIGIDVWEWVEGLRNLPTSHECGQHG